MKNKLRILWYSQIALLALIGITGVILLGIFIFFAADLPNPDRIVRREGFATKIFDRNGDLLYDVFGDQRRTPIDIKDVPNYLKQATIAIEDKTFLKRGIGIDPWGPLRIAWNVITKGRVIGASGLTQQVVKNVLLSSERTLTRKFKELILTLQIEQRYSKEKILQMYLNEAPYGGTAWGVGAAAESFFGKKVSELTLTESAILAGLPQSPTFYSPYRGKAYLDRAAEVLRRMREDGYISRELELQAKLDLPKVNIASSSGLLKAPHFVFYVKDLLIERFGEKAVEEGGLRVTTSLDLDLQEVAQKAVAEEISKVKNLRIGNGAVVAVDPQNGQILAMVGSKGWEDPNYDGKFNVATASRQPGSSIKPLVYLTGLRKGYTAATLFMDTKTSFPGGDKPEYIPENYDGKFRGPILMREALGNSINVPAVKMAALAGVYDILDLGYQMGLTTFKPTKETLSRVGLSLALGGGEVRLLDLVTAYSSIANTGFKAEPVAILKVTDINGKVLYEGKPTPPKRVISEGEAFIISSMLSDPKAREITFGPRSAINIPGKTIAVKTGTTNDKRDNWTIGWSPSIIVGVWVGNNDNSPMKDVASGVTGAAPIWRRVILESLKDKTDEPFVQPDQVIGMEVDKISGFAAHDSFESKSEFFIKGTQPVGPDPVHKKMRVCSGEEKEFYVLKEDDSKWQEAIDNWLKEQADSKYHPESAQTCGNQIWLTVHEPNDKSQVSGNDVKIRFDVSSPRPIKKVRFVVDGQLKQTLENQPWEVVVNMTDGWHQIDLEAEDEQGQTGSRKVLISVNQPYTEPVPTTSP